MIEDLQKFLNQEMHERNNRAVPEFEGYSPNEMNQLLYRPFEQSSPVEILRLEKQEYEQIPMLSLIRYLAGLIQEKKELKLTQKGFLPVKVVGDLCSHEFLHKIHPRIRLDRVKESDSVAASLGRFMLDLAGITKKRNNKLSITKKGEKLLANDEELLRVLLDVYCTRFNWAYYGYYQERIGQTGFGFSLVLLSKYGKQKRQDSFYAEKYFKAFPQMIPLDPPPPFGDVLSTVARAYSDRTFDDFLKFFGLVEVEQEKWDSEKFITKTGLFDKLIRIKPPGYLQ